jgi:nicotinate phosphoribosyltransferase
MLQCPSVEEIISGNVTDHCCTLSVEVLRRLGIANRTVTLEAHVRRFPPDISHGLFYGLGDVLEVLGGRSVTLWSMRPGSVFFEREPVLIAEGPAEALATIRPAITGALTFGTSLLSRANEIVRIAEGRQVHFFGSRKLHPMHVRQYLECAYVAGMEINANPQAIQIVRDLKLEDCQEHFANLIADRPEDSWREFLNLPPSSGAVFIVLDNYDDPVSEAKTAALALGARLRGILIDTDSSRRGDIKNIIAEVAWNLRLIDRADVQICLTGGVSPEVIRETREHVRSYGVGLSALEGPVFDFALQVVAVDGRPKAKLGVKPGKKAVYVCSNCARRVVDLFPKEIDCCESPMTALMSRPDHEHSRDLKSIRAVIRRNEN